MYADTLAKTRRKVIVTLSIPEIMEIALDWLNK